MAHVGIVLSGGGARGAYEAGVLWGIHEALGAARHPRPLFDIVSGSSVGAINGAWLAANAHRPDHDLSGLVKVWQGLSFAKHVRFDLRALVGSFRDTERLGRSLLDPRALEALVHESLDWAKLHENIAQGRMRALIVSALHVVRGDVREP
jgi:NTE family protein